MHVRQTQRHRHQLGKEVDRVDEHGFHARLLELPRQSFQHRRAPTRVHLLKSKPEYVCTLQGGQMRKGPRSRTLRTLFFSEGHELQPGATYGVLGVRKAEESGLVAAGLKFVCQPDHRMEVSGERQTNESKFHLGGGWS